MNLHPTPAERLLAMLEEDGSIETLPPGAVRGELASLGVDPARSIAFARALAEGGDSPGGRLLGSLLSGEDEDDEIARIEAADIDEVKAQVAGGAAAAIAAEARRRAGLKDNVVGLADKRRRRRRLIVWGGPLAGIAASFLVLVVVMSNAYFGSQRSEIAEEIKSKTAMAPPPEMPDPAAEGYARPGPDSSLTDELLAEGAQPRPESDDLAKKEDLADLAPTLDGESFALAEPQAESPAGEKDEAAPADAEARRDERQELAAAPAAPPPPAATESPAEAPSKSLARTREAETAQDSGAAGNVGLMAGAPTVDESPPVLVVPQQDRRNGGDTQVASKPAPEAGLGAGRVFDVEISEIAAVLVVDPARVSMQVQSQALPAGGLEGRLDEARGLAGDRPVIALYTVASGEMRRDFAQVPLRPGLTQQLAAPPPLVGLLGVEARDYDFIALPDRPAR